MTPLPLAALDGFEEERRGGALVCRDESAVRQHGGELVFEQADAHGDRQREIGRFTSALLGEGHELVTLEAWHAAMVAFGRTLFI